MFILIHVNVALSRITYLVRNVSMKRLIEIEQSPSFVCFSFNQLGLRKSSAFYLVSNNANFE